MEKDTEYWRIAKARVAAFQKADPRLELVFGSKGHKYELLPPVVEHSLTAFEVANGVSLPSEYREFLAVMGSGGAGPDYGLYDFHKIAAYHVGEWFPLTESREWTETDDDSLSRLPGLLTISTSGCGIDWFLEVNGPQPGTMWVDAGPGIELMNRGQFGDWFGAWLDRVELGIRKYDELRAFVARQPPLSEVKAMMLVKPHEYEEEGVRYLRFLGVPGRVRIDGEVAASLEVGTCWIT